MATVLSPPEQRIVLDNIRWETYESILEAYMDRSVPHFTYDRGRLEIMSPSAEHEDLNRAAARLVEVIAEELDLDMRNLGSTTFRREDLDRGFEPDLCFYIQSVERIRGKTELNLKTDPPPDLVIEIDITSPSINKFPIFAQLGVPEVWRYEGKRWIILVLEGEGYVEREESAALPGLTVSVISRFIEEGRDLRRPEWLRRVRSWAKQDR
ncbi:MAG: Uma2 family endonuclease [Pyrinomonadaceae bacterium]|nr:Uma2 family endonuclease [Pyrinomonadaceae bacterium]